MDFEAFWKVYPKKVAKLAARRAWDKARKQVDPAVIVEALKRQVAAGVFVEPFVPYPATWLNAGRWEDEMPGEGAAGPVVELAKAFREACRAGSESAKKAVRERARRMGVAWGTVNDEIGRQFEEERL